MKSTVWMALLFCGVGGAAAGAFHAARGAAPPVASVPAALRVPMRGDRITIDGESDDPGWPRRAGRTGPFRSSDRRIARPYSEARTAWGDGKLYVMLYAADEDIVAPVERPDGPVGNDDAFRLSFFTPSGERVIEVSALGVVSDAVRRADGTLDYGWQSGAEVAHDVDGTPNVPGDDDEEWIIELAVPLAALGLDGRAGARMPVAVERCDRARDATRTCTKWSAEIELAACRGDDCPP